MGNRKKAQRSFIFYNNVFKTVQSVILTIAVCAIVPVPRLHYHSVRSLKQEERKKGDRGYHSAR